MSENIGKKIKSIRDSQNLSQDRFAKKIGVSGKTISAYETGRTIPPLKILEKISSTYKKPYTSMSDETKILIKNNLEKLELEILQLKDMLHENFNI